jgi:hypothetical protein
MSARLQELLRQKALLEEQAAWLAREIAAEQARAGADPTPPVSPAAPALAPSPSALDVEAAAIIDQYRDSAETNPQQVKRGCILYFIGVLVLIALGLLAIHFMAHRR